MEENIEKQNLSKLAVKGSAYGLIYLFVSKFGGLIFTIVIARLLLPELFGIYSLALSIMTIFLVLTDLGIDNTFLRYFSESLQKKDGAEPRSYFWHLLKIKSIISLSVILIMILLSGYLSETIYEKPALFYPLIFSSLFVLSESARTIIAAIFTAKKDFKSPVFFVISLQTLNIGLSIFAVLTFTDAFKVSGIFLAFFISSFTTLILMIYILMKKDKAIFKGNLIKINKKKLNNYWKFMILTSISLTLFGSIDILMLGRFVSPGYLGYYRAAASLVITISSLFLLSGIFLPIFTQIKGNRFERGFKKIYKYMVVLALPSSMGVLFLAKYIIKIIYGNEYLFGAYPTYFLVPLIITTPLISLYSTLFQSKEKPKIVGNSVLVSLSINIILNIIAILLLSNNQLHLISGVGLSTSLSRVLLLFILIRSSKKYFGFKQGGIEIWKPLIATASLCAFLIIYNKIFDINLFSGGMEVILGICMYFGILFSIKGLGKKDLKLFRESILGKKFN